MKEESKEELEEKYTTIAQVFADMVIDLQDDGFKTKEIVETGLSVLFSMCINCAPSKLHLMDTISRAIEVAVAHNIPDEEKDHENTV